MRVLSWNLRHGRARTPVHRPLLADFCATLAGWEWDVALLQEVPSWWPPDLARETRSEPHVALTSRNFGRALRRRIASRDPELLKSGGGGCNAILVRGGGGRDHRRARLAWLPERRIAHGVRLRGGWVVNLHASVRPPERIPGDIARARAAALAWSAGAPLIVGGDFNLRDPRMPGFERAGGAWVDHVYARGWRSAGSESLDAGMLSDHAPLRVVLEPAK